MFDPPDYPYNLSETLKEYGSDDLLFNNECTILPNINNLGVTSTIKSNISEKLFHQNDSGRYFTMPVTLTNPIATGATVNTDLLIIQSENILNDPPILLDDNTVNQFLLPVQVPPTENKDTVESGPDLLSLQSCVLCHEIFTSDADLLCHTIAFHASDNTIEQSLQLSPRASNLDDNLLNPETSPNSVDLETEWLVCCMCDRVLSTALEIETTVQLCCSDGTDKSTAMKRKLHTMFVCDFCNGLFASAESLDKHKNTCNIPQDQSYYYTETTNPHEFQNVGSPQKTNICFACGRCKTQCSDAEELKAHTEICHKYLRPKSSKNSYAISASNKMWNCGSCNQLFATARELYRHKRGEDRPAGVPLTAYVCEECDKVLGSMCALHTHRKMHKGYPCRICGRRFNQSGHLAIHMRMHTGERPYPCDLCPKAFKVKVERDDHRRTHTGERPFACTACPKTFTAAARLREHARIHTDQRPYRCDICGAAFRRPYARTVHTLIHTGEKPHACDICGTSFRRSGDMWKHKRTIHGTQLAADDGKTVEPSQSHLN